MNLKQTSVIPEGLNYKNARFANIFGFYSQEILNQKPYEGNHGLLEARKICLHFFSFDILAKYCLFIIIQLVYRKNVSREKLNTVIVTIINLINPQSCSVISLVNM